MAKWLSVHQESVTWMKKLIVGSLNIPHTEMTESAVGVAASCRFCSIGGPSSCSCAENLSACLSKIASCEAALLGLVESYKLTTEYSSLDEESTIIVAEVKSAIAVTKTCLGPVFVESLNATKWTARFPSYLLLDVGHYLLPQGDGGWDATPLNVFTVRGNGYSPGSNKVPSDPPLFHLRFVLMFQSEAPMGNIINDSRFSLPLCFPSKDWLMLNVMIPGKTNINIVSVYSASETASVVLRSSDGASSSHAEGSGWKSCLQSFWSADKDFCDSRFKLIPNFVEGSWAVRSAVGQKPALIGTKLNQMYIRRENVLEVDMDISSSSIATGILRLVRGLSKRVIIDLGIVIQGESADELPERLLCQSRYVHVDMENCDIICSIR